MTDVADQIGDDAEQVTMDQGANTMNTSVADTKSNRGRAGVSYLGKGLNLEVLDELPDSIVAEQGSRKSRQYYEILENVGENAETYGKWVPIVKFSTPNGAMAVCNRFRKQLQGHVMDDATAELPAKERDAKFRGWLTAEQTTEIPEYEGWHWEFDFRRVNSDRGPNDLDSILYAKILPDEDGNGQFEQGPSAPTNAPADEDEQ